MTDPVQLTAAVPDLLRNTVVPFTDGRVTINSADLVHVTGQSVTVRVEFAVDGEGTDHFDFEVDDSWGFGSTQDVLDQLRVDLIEYLDTGGVQPERPAAN